jgi:homoaconitase/3-isopropylmalate dehydratase large subunit
LVTGEIWFKIPEIVEIRFVGEPPIGIGGKDVILYILQQLKRNTVAADRVVEYTGPGLKHLSCDARFAIANMTTVGFPCHMHTVSRTDLFQEFGGITGIFVPDEVTLDFVTSRKNPRNKSNSHYFRPDTDAIYASTHEIDLKTVKPFIAKYPNPDDVVSVTDFEGTELDGCFIGACTTAEEDIILGALVLEQGLKQGKKPATKGKRKVTPGSKPIVKKLEETGLADIYRAAGFEIGIPGCSYCVGMSADKAGEGEVWLSSQNRNFENRMGRGKSVHIDCPATSLTLLTGSIGNLASAATVAASSFDMRATDPTMLIKSIDIERWTKLRRHQSIEEHTILIAYVEPAGQAEEVEVTQTQGGNGKDESEVKGPGMTSSTDIIGKVYRLGDMIDTDAVSQIKHLLCVNL